MTQSRARGAIKAAVFAALPDAYKAVSDSFRLPVIARNLGYEVRLSSGLGDELRLDYFLKRLLDAYIEANPDETARWDILRDDRGTFNEPHTGVSVPLGTKEVREYLRYDGVDLGVSAPEFDLLYPTQGPRDRFGAIFYIEKEGFAELLAADHVQERWDLAIASCKGYSVRAARHLLRTLADRFPHVPVLVAHDFDKAGIGIYDLLDIPNKVDLGLRIDDVHDKRWKLAATGSEPVRYEIGSGRNRKPYDPRPNLRERGATEEEIAFLCSTTGPEFAGRRVELNALTGRTFIRWLEAKLDKHGVKKVVPNQETLARAYRRAYQRAILNKRIESLFDEVAALAEAAPVPPRIVTRVTTALAADRRLTWDDEVARLAREAATDDGGAR